jgi:hypothetical protein
MVNSMLLVTGTGDHDRPEWLITINGIRKRWTASWARCGAMRQGGHGAGLRRRRLSGAACRCAHSPIGRIRHPGSSRRIWWRIAALLRLAASCRHWWLTDIATGWTKCAPLLVREQQVVTEVLTQMRRQLPFALLNFDTDNDSVFINETVRDYCADAGV